jgi:RNA polymerase sigma-70 factor, ECF subfamily
MSPFEEQVLAALPRLRRYARSLSRDASEAEDLVHDCLENAFANRLRWRGTNLDAWLMTILTNLGRNKWRSRRRRPEIVPLEAAAEVPSGQPDPDPLAKDRLSRAIEHLDHDQRAVLMLVVVDGYRYAEVAGMLGVPIGTVMSRLSRARKALGEMLEGDNVVEFRRSS